MFYNSSRILTPKTLSVNKKYNILYPQKKKDTISAVFLSTDDLKRGVLMPAPASVQMPARHIQKGPAAKVPRGPGISVYQLKFVTRVMILNAKSTNAIHITGLTSFAFPSATFKITHATMANMIPVAMEYARGIMSIAR